MLGKYNTKVVLPKTKSELVKSINGLGQVDINVLEPIDKSNVGFVKSEIDRFVGNGKNEVSVVFIKKK
ncbi:MAG: hypothetical protein O2950_05915 [Proteobacteria bacterium]|nr:hypothetical protein [Pseudomonadota bacterium]